MAATMTLPRPRAGGLAFINANPAAAAAAKEEQRLRAERKDDAAMAADAATRAAYAQMYAAQAQPEQPATAAEPSVPTANPTAGGETIPTAGPASAASPPKTGEVPAQSPLNSAISRLTNVPGAGAAIGRLVQGQQRIQQGQQRLTAQQERQNAQYEQRGLVALARGDVAAADHWFARAGFSMPEELRQNSVAQGLFARGSLLGRGLYPNREQALAFTQAFVQSGGDVNAATAAAGTPRPAARAASASSGGGSAGRMSPTTYVDPETGETTRGYWDPRNPGAGVRPLMVAPGTQRPAPASGVPGAAAPPAPPDGAGQTEPSPPTSEGAPLTPNLVLPPPSRAAVAPGGRSAAAEEARISGRIREATIRAEAAIKAAEARGASAAEVARIRGAAAAEVANIRAGAATGVAGINADARTGSAQIGADARTGAARIAADQRARAAEQQVEQRAKAAEARGASAAEVAGIRRQGAEEVARIRAEATTTAATARAGTGARGGAGNTRTQAVYDMAIRAGHSEQEAAQIAAGIIPSASSISNAYLRIRSGIVNSIPGLNLTPSQVDAEASKQMDSLYGPGWRNRVRLPGAPQGGGGLTRVEAPAAPAAPPAAAQQPPAPAQPPAAAAPTLPPQAVARLREGTVTTFSNGQKWTLRGGRPVQVQ